MHGKCDDTSSIPKVPKTFLRVHDEKEIRTELVQMQFSARFMFIFRNIRLSRFT